MNETYIIDLNHNILESEEFEIDDKNLIDTRIQLPDGSIVSGDRYKVLLTLSPDAMIGFGTNLIRKGFRARKLDEDSYIQESEHLMPIYENNAVLNMGVYLAPDSAELIVMAGDFGTVEDIMEKLRSQS